MINEKSNNLIRKYMLLFLIFLVTAISYNGFFQKWGFRDGEPRFSFIKIVNGTADRPFVYRRLMPIIASAIENSIPPTKRVKLKEKLLAHNAIYKNYKRATESNTDYVLSYHLIYLMSFLFFFASILLLRRICIDATQDPVAGTLASLAFALLFPLLQTVGGYFYDISELFFITAAVLCAWRGWWIPLILLSPLAVINKESFLFFLVTLYPLLSHKKNPRFTTGVLACAGILATPVYLWVKSLYVSNPGGAVEWHFIEQLKYFLNPGSYFKTEYNYAMLTGAGFFFAHVLFVAVVVKAAWPKMNSTWKKYTKAALAINLPLFVLFCSPGEIRNLSLLYIPFAVMLSLFISEVIYKDVRKEAKISDLSRELAMK